MTIVFNPGNGYAKMAWFDADNTLRTRKLRSAIAEATELDTDAYSLQLINNSGRPRNGYTYNPWVMSPTGDTPYYIENGKSIYALQLLIGLAWDLIEDGMHIDLHVLVHAPGQLQQDIKANLSKVHTCLHNGVTKTFRIDVVKVTREGMGLCATAPKHDIALLDWGADTLNPWRIPYGRPNKELIINAITQYGTSGLIRRLIEHEPASIGANPTVANAIKAIEANTLGPSADSVIQEFWSDSLTAVRRANLDLIRGVDAVYLAGGLTRCKRFTAIALADPIKPKVIPHAQMADVSGYCTMLQQAGRIRTQ